LTCHDPFDGWQKYPPAELINPISLGSYVSPDKIGPVAGSATVSNFGWSIAGQLGSGVCTVGSAVASATPSSSYVGAALKVAGYLLSLIPSPPGLPYSGAGCEDQFISDLAAGNVSPAVQNMVSTLGTQGESLVWGGSYGHLAFTLSPKITQYKMWMVGYKWDANGFAGLSTDYYTYPDQPYNQFYWTLDSQ
jgi:hypothetical protein